MSVTCFVAGSYTASCRPERSTGVALAEGRSDPALQYAGLSAPRIRAVIHNRPRSSNIGLCTVVWLSQIASSPQMGDGLSGFGCPGVFGSRYGIFTRLSLKCTGSSAGSSSLLSSGDP